MQREIERCKMQQELITDSLTKIHNRVALRDAFSDMEKDASGCSYYFAMLDLDNFKMLNDTFGHEKGDQCLAEAGRILKSFCVEDATPYRFGGDEFCILFKNKEEEAVLLTLENIQEELRKNLRNKFGVPVTVSIGVAKYTNNMTATQLLQKADMKMYQAKRKKDIIAIDSVITFS